MPTRRPPHPRIDLRLLTYLHAVARTGNISRAAEELNIAQPTLSKAIRLLEDQVGAELFQRHAHGVTLTPLARRLDQHAMAVRAQVARAEAEIEEQLSGAAGEIRIGAGPSWVRRFLPDAVAQLHHERPSLRVQLISGFDISLLDGLVTGELDFVVAELPLERSSKFRLQFLTSDNLVVAARDSHPLAGRASVSADEALAGEWALPPNDSLASRKLSGRVLSLGKVPPKPVMTSSSWPFLVNTCRQADLLIYTTRSLLQAEEGRGFCEIAVPELITSRDAGIIYRDGALLSPGAERLAELLTAACAGDVRN